MHEDSISGSDRDYGGVGVDGDNGGGVGVDGSVGVDGDIGGVNE